MNQPEWQRVEQAQQAAADARRARQEAANHAAACERRAAGEWCNECDATRGRAEAAQRTSDRRNGRD